MIDTSMNPTDLKYFLTVAETLNISRAAERIGVGQPALSMALKRLESDLRSTLLIRQKTGVRLTTSGHLLAARGRKVLEDLQNLSRALVSSQESIEGRFILGCHSSVAIYALPKFLKKLLEKNPKLEIHLIHKLSREIHEDIIGFRADFGIIVNPTPHPDLVIRELAKDEVGFWSEKGSLDDCLIFDPQLIQAQNLLRKLKKSKETQFKRFVHSSNLEVISKLTSAGCGVGILPARVATQYSNLQTLGSTWPSYEDRICLTYRADSQKTAAARAIVAAIKAAKI